MTRFEEIKTMTEEELAEVLCDIVHSTHKNADNDFDRCEACPASKYCGKGHTGFIDWLKRGWNDE